MPDYPRTIDDVRTLHPDRKVFEMNWPVPGKMEVGVSAASPNEVATIRYVVADTRPLAVQAMWSFHFAAMRTLYKLRGPGHLTHVAKIVGESPSNYHDAALTHKRGGSLDRVAKWISRWNAAGLPPFVLVVTPECAVVAPARWAWLRDEAGGTSVVGSGPSIDVAQAQANVSDWQFGVQEKGPRFGTAGFAVPVGIAAPYEEWEQAACAVTRAWGAGD